ncbi:hypothetical protein FACS189432_05030 [Bacteroidia bacterium]|nr:hypothetical protein FACS189432_05030 [Bacteroidia bacterium]
MKRIVFLFIISVFFCNISAQKITKNEKDEFTGRQVIETSWVSISDGFTCQIRVIDGFTFLKAGFNCGDHVYAMEDGADFMIKLDNDSIITLANLEYSIAKRESNRHWCRNRV